jgi:hypothetical protein
MPRATYGALVGVLHEDKKNVTQKQKDDALGMLTDWWKKTENARRSR